MEEWGDLVEVAVEDMVASVDGVAAHQEAAEGMEDALDHQESEEHQEDHPEAAVQLKKLPVKA